MLVATGVASPRRSAGRRARPVWRASVAMPATAMLPVWRGSWMACAFRRSASLFGFFRRCRQQKPGCGCAAGTLTLIRPRAAGEGGTAHLRGGGGARRGDLICDVVPALMPRPLPPRYARSPFPASRGRMRCRASGAAEAPSTMLRMVPLPRFAGQDKLRAHARASTDDWKCASPSAYVVGARGPVVESLA